MVDAVKLFKRRPHEGSQAGYRGVLAYTVGIGAGAFSFDLRSSVVPFAQEACTRAAHIQAEEEVRRRHVGEDGRRRTVA
jgi:hypothetical protein